MSTRLMQFAGSFYPNESENILKYIKSFNAKLNDDNSLNEEDIKALIVPHAGYVYSGYTANLAYLKASRKEYETIVVIGPSHKVSFEGSSIALFDKYETPLGNIDINLEYSKSLMQEFDFLGFNQAAHLEHSTETQAPFIKHYFPKSKVVEIVYALQDYESLSALCTKILQKKNTLLIISTDLSHFYNLQKAQYLDSICIEAIKTKNINMLKEGEACGKLGVKALLSSCFENNLETNFLHYCTSAERSFDKSSVVGYTSFYIK